MAILSWIVFTVAIGLIKPPPHSCWREMNSTHQVIERVSYSTSTITSNIKLIVKRQIIKTSTSTLNKSKDIIDRQNRLMNTTILTKTTIRRRKPTIKPTTLSSKLLQEDNDIESSSEEDNPINENNRVTSINFLPINKPQKTMGNPLSIIHTNFSLVKPLASPILYEKKDVRNVFMVFLLLIIIGEFFSAPAITLAVSSRSYYFVFTGKLFSLEFIYGKLIFFPLRLV
jgi:hypothetical protein